MSHPNSSPDGKVEKWEMEVFDRIKKADEDKSGSISVKELFGVIKGAAESDKAKKLFQKLLGVAFVIIVFLLVANFVLVVVANTLTSAIASKGGTGAMMSKETGIAAKTGAVNTPISAVSARMRRLKTIGNRRMLMEGMIDSTIASTMVSDHKQTGMTDTTMSFMSATQEYDHHDHDYHTTDTSMPPTPPAPTPPGPSPPWWHYPPAPPYQQEPFPPEPSPPPAASPSPPYEYTIANAPPTPPLVTAADLASGMGAGGSTNETTSTMINMKMTATQETSGLATPMTRRALRARILRELRKSDSMIQRASRRLSVAAGYASNSDGTTDEEEAYIRERLIEAGMILTHLPERRLDVQPKRQLGHEGTYTYSYEPAADAKPAVDPVEGKPVTWPTEGCATFDGTGCVTVIPGSESGSGEPEYVYKPSPPPAPTPPAEEAAKVEAFMTRSAATVMTFVDTSPAGAADSQSSVMAPPVGTRRGLWGGAKTLGGGAKTRTGTGLAGQNTEPATTYVLITPRKRTTTADDDGTTSDDGDDEAPTLPAAFFTMPQGRWRELSISEGISYRRRKLAEYNIPEHVDSSNMHFDECIVYHCFVGDDHCEEPSPADACLKIAEDGSCADPLCLIHEPQTED